MAHDVFISYSTEDKPTADAVCASLESKGVRCWIAPRDVLPGVFWAEAIIEALDASKLMVLVFSSHSNASTQVMREVERAASRDLPILPLRIENVLPAKSIEYFLSSPHWLDAMTPPLKRHLDRLGKNVEALLERGTAIAEAGLLPPQAPDGGATTVPLRRRPSDRRIGVGVFRDWRYIAAGAVAAGALAAVVGALALASAGGGGGRLVTRDATATAGAAPAATSTQAAKNYIADLLTQQAQTSTAPAGGTATPASGGPGLSGPAPTARLASQIPSLPNTQPPTQTLAPAPTSTPPSPVAGPPPNGSGDRCYYTPAGQAVDQNGCSDAQVDADGDDVCENATSPGTPWCHGTDRCFYTAAGQAVDANGCSDSQVDADGDDVCENATSPGTTNCTGTDRCFYTPAGQPVDANGCSDSQVDADGDNVCENATSPGTTNCTGTDRCFYTPAGQAVDVNGCSDYQVDADGDNVCENATSPGTPWCSGTDKCFYTPAGQPVNASGCSASQSRTIVPSSGVSLARYVPPRSDAPPIDPPEILRA